MERVWPPCPGARSTSFIESLALLAAGSVMPIACYQIMFSFLYICIYLFMSACICFTVLLAYDIFTLPTACIFTIACLLPTKLQAELTCTVPMRALLWPTAATLVRPACAAPRESTSTFDRPLLGYRLCNIRSKC